MKLKVLGIIPARENSKRIPKKNIYPVLGKPLIWYIIQAAKGAKTLDKIIVSTDSQEIAKLIQKYESSPLQSGGVSSLVGRLLFCLLPASLKSETFRRRENKVEVPFLRPKNLAKDDTPDLPVFQHALDQLEKLGKKFDIIVNLRPTAPLLKPKDIDAAVKLLIRTQADSVRSMHEADQPPFWMKIVDAKGQAHHFLPGKDEHRHPTRKSLPQKVYQLNAQVDVMRSCWIKKGKLYGNKMWAYIMDKNQVIDVDSLPDIYATEAILSHEANKN